MYLGFVFSVEYDVVSGVVLHDGGLDELAELVALKEFVDFAFLKSLHHDVSKQDVLEIPQDAVQQLSPDGDTHCIVLRSYGRAARLFVQQGALSKVISFLGTSTNTRTRHDLEKTEKPRAKQREEKSRSERERERQTDRETKRRRARDTDD